MSLATYTDLQTAIANYLARPGDTLVSTPAPDFITLAESRIHYGSSDDSPFPSKPLRIRAMETSCALTVTAATTGGTVAGTANAITLTNSPVIASLAVGTHVGFVAALANTAATTLAIDSTGAIAVKKGSARSALAGGEIVLGANYETYYDGTYHVLMPTSADVPLPANYLAMRSVYLDVNPRVVIDYMTPDQLNYQYQYSYTNQPEAYTIEEDAIRFGPSPDGAYKLVALYYKKFDALSGAAGGVNWLMTNKPDVYLYASLLEAAIYFGMDDDTVKWHKLYLGACNGLQEQDERDRHSGGRLQMRVRGMTP